MDTRPEPPPEGRLIDDARDRAGISVREAARRTGISNTRWNQIAKGSHAPARTIARMARAVGVTPAQLEGCRPDAAAILAVLLAEDAALPATAVAGSADPDAMTLLGEAVAEKMLAVAGEVAGEIDAARRAGIPEDRIFTDAAEQARWARSLSEADRVILIAGLRMTRPRPPRRNSGNPPIGLAG